MLAMQLGRKSLSSAMLSAIGATNFNNSMSLMILLIRLRTLSSVESRRLEALRKIPRTDDVRKVIDWLRNGGAQHFEHEVLLPPVLTLGVKDLSLAPLVESFFGHKEQTVWLSERG
jgi:hypothetical protein